MAWVVDNAGLFRRASASARSVAAPSPAVALRMLKVHPRIVKPQTLHFSSLENIEAVGLEGIFFDQYRSPVTVCQPRQAVGKPGLTPG